MRHDFENFPSGTSPHTTAPFDYLIVTLAMTLTPLSKNAFDLAGAVVSPLISIALGIFLCSWSRKMRLRFRWGLLILYAVSPMLAHGFALGRPDHQSLLVALITIALCAEWALASGPSPSRGIALRAAGFARDRRRVLCALYDEVGTANGLDCFCRGSRNCIYH